MRTEAVREVNYHVLDQLDRFACHAGSGLVPTDSCNLEVIPLVFLAK